MYPPKPPGGKGRLKKKDWEKGLGEPPLEKEKGAPFGKKGELKATPALPLIFRNLGWELVLKRGRFVHTNFPPFFFFKKFGGKNRPEEIILNLKPRLIP